MAPSKPDVYPVETLREHIVSLEAAITLALADPKKDPVHRLRTSTRRIEAQLELLSLLPDLPLHTKLVKKTRKLLKKLRRAAGLVRDLDVQRNLIQQQVPATSPKKLRHEARDLRRTLRDRRSAEADNLQPILEMEQRKLAPLLERLLDTLEPARDFSISRRQLAELTLLLYQRGVLSTSTTSTTDDPDVLHSVRKYAKLARYVAESGDPSLSHRFESIQQAGGTWHDLLTLAAIACKQLGPRSSLSQAVTQQRDIALKAYREALRTQPAR